MDNSNKKLPNHKKEKNDEFTVFEMIVDKLSNNCKDSLRQEEIETLANDILIELQNRFNITPISVPKLKKSKIKHK